MIQIESSLTKKQAEQLRRCINAYVKASIAYSWRGGGDPLDIPCIEANYKLQKAALDAFINKFVRYGAD